MRKSAFAALCIISLFAAVLGSLVPSGSIVDANGVPHEIILTYLQGLSNWGPTSATGVAEVVPKEGQVSIRVVGLPALANESYSGWLINSKTNQAMYVGRLNTDKSETGKVQVSLPSEIPDFGWNLFLLTVEPDGQTPQSPGNRKSIGGYISDSAESKQIPAQLPKTGGDTDASVSHVATPPQTDAALSRQQSKTDNTSNLLPYGVVVVAAIGIGMVGRSRMRRR